MADSPVLRWAGVTVSATVYGLILWSGLSLGRFYSQEVTIQKDHRLITRGPYHAVRHPRYLGILALSYGLSLLFRSWIGLIASTLFVGVLLLRIQDEEALLRKEFGPEWDTYCKQSWRLVPFIY